LTGTSKSHQHTLALTASINSSGEKKKSPTKNRTKGSPMHTLHDYTRNNDVSSLKAALRAGADVNSVNEFGWTALHLAAWKGHSECAKVR